MARADLLALTPDDLATLSNRGTVKRAQKELEAGELTWELTEPDGDLLFIWSDGTTCRFPADKAVRDARCSSGSLGISRHVIRSVLAYQRVHAQTPLASAEPVSALTPMSPPEIVPAPTTTRGATWDPGALSDEALAAAFRKPALAQARKRFDQGVLVELTRGAKPTARFLDEGCTIRFLVPHDLRYVTGDCAEAQLPQWTALAVWSFRALPAERLAGLLSLQESELPVPQTSLDTLAALLRELGRDGLAGVPATWSQRLTRLETALRADGLVWPAELVADLLHQQAMYAQHDARFEPHEVRQLVGELLIRSRAIGRATRSVPQPLIRGTRSDRAAEIAGGRLIGVGLGVRPGPRHTTIGAYLQDVDSGNVVAVERTFADPDPAAGETPRSFADLAGTVLVRGVSLAGLAASQLLLKSGKRTPSGQLILPRTASSLTTHPQNYQWEQLKPPFAAESFAQLEARLESLPPSALRPRRRTENVYAIAIAGVDAVEFDVAHQQLVARITDADGRTARLVHPFHARSRAAFDDWKTALDERGSQARFVCGHVRSRGKQLQIHPLCLVLADGEQRTAVYPWLPQSQASASTRTAPSFAEAASPEPAPLSNFLDRLDGQLADSLLTGLATARESTWKELRDSARALGFVRLTQPLAAVAETLVQRSNTLHWNAEPAVENILELCLLARLASETRG